MALGRPYSSEREMCDVLATSARIVGATVYPETGGWDLVLVHGEEQIGVQAKLKANIDVLYQALEPRMTSGRRGPDASAIAVPSATGAFLAICQHLALGVIQVAHHDPLLGRIRLALDRLPRRPFESRLWLPPVVPDVPAGVPSPQTLSEWKVGALRLCRLLRARAATGVTGKEIEARGMNVSTWRNRWLDPIPHSRPRRYTINPNVTLPDVGMETTAEAIEAADLIAAPPPAPRGQAG